MRPREYRRKMHQRSQAERLKRLGGHPLAYLFEFPDAKVTISRDMQGAYVHTVEPK